MAKKMFGTSLDALDSPADASALARVSKALGARAGALLRAPADVVIAESCSSGETAWVTARHVLTEVNPSDLDSRDPDELVAIAVRAAELSPAATWCSGWETGASTIVGLNDGAAQPRDVALVASVLEVLGSVAGYKRWF